MSEEIPAEEGSTQQLISELRAEVEQLRKRVEKSERNDSVSIVCFSGEWDRLFAVFTIANGALALGQDVHVFFTFWGATAVRKSVENPTIKRSWMQRMLGKMLPGDISSAPLSKMHYWGLGKHMMGRLMKQKGIQDLPSLMQDARDLGAKFYYCDTSLTMFGWGNEDLVDGDKSEWCGVSTFLSQALKSRIVLFI